MVSYGRYFVINGNGNFRLKADVEDPCLKVGSRPEAVFRTAIVTVCFVDSRRRQELNKTSPTNSSMLVKGAVHVNSIFKLTGKDIGHLSMIGYFHFRLCWRSR